MLNKIKNLKINFALLVFVAYAVKMIVITPSFADGVVMAVLTALYGYTRYLAQFQRYDIDEAVKKDLIEVKSVLSKLSLAQSRDKMRNNRYF